MVDMIPALHSPGTEFEEEMGVRGRDIIGDSENLARLGAAGY